MKMKNFLKASLALCLVVMFGCEQTEAPIFEGSFVAFDGTIATRSESDPAFEITITGTEPGLSSSLSFEGSAQLGVDFNVDSETVTIGDDYVTTLTVTPINNILVDGTRQVNISLVEGGFPGGAAGKVFTVRLLDDDCPYEEATFLGEFTANDPGNPFNGFPNEYTVEVTADGATEGRFVVSDFLGLTAGGFGPRSFYMDVSTDVTDPTVTIPVQPLQPRITSGGARIGIGATGDGTYVSCDGSVTVEIQVLALQDDGGTTVLGAFTAPYTFTLNK